MNPSDLDSYLKIIREQNMEMKPKRYLLVKKAISEKEAQEIKNQHIEYSENNLLIAQEELEDARKYPLQLERIQQVEIGPDHPQWNEAHIEWSPIHYTGDFKFETIKE